MNAYESHFGLAQPLFQDGLAQGDRVYRTQALGRLAEDLAIALTRKDTVVILSGPSGTGKSTLAAESLKDIHTRLAFTCISHAPLTAHELLEQLLVDFGFEPYKHSRVERLQIWRQFLSEMAATDTRVCLLIENADELPVDVMLHLHKLTAADAALSPGANVILTTSQPTERLLASEELVAFNQRVRLRSSLVALAREETAEYLRFKCRLGEVDYGSLLEADVAGCLHDLSGGIIRVIDNLLESALIAAAAADDKHLTSARIREVADQQFGIRELAPAAVDEILDSTPEEVASSDADAADQNADDIPTLTDFIALAGDTDFLGRDTSTTLEALALAAARGSTQH